MSEDPDRLEALGKRFLVERAPWLRVETVDRDHDGWDVVLRIDGTYFGETSASRDDLVAFFTDWIRAELGPAAQLARYLR